MKISSNTTVGEIVAGNYNLAPFFRQYHIDFCCNGNRTITEICNEKLLDINEFIGSILEFRGDKKNEGDFDSWDIGFLADYIYQEHHLYVERMTSEILFNLNKICTVHGKKHPELLKVRELFKESSGELAIHMKKEEFLLFPQIKRIARAYSHGETYVNPSFETIETPIKAMHTDHDSEGVRFRKIEALTNNYTPPTDACTTYKLVFLQLEEFEKDLHKHIHLENNILFKKAIAIEKKLNN